MMDRRQFLKGMAGILAACAAPAIVQSGSLMRINPKIITPADFNQRTLGGMYGDDSGVICLYNRAGEILAMIPLERTGNATLGTGANAHGEVMRAGLIEEARIRLPGMPEHKMNIEWDNRILTDDSTVNIHGVKIQ